MGNGGTQQVLRKWWIGLPCPLPPLPSQLSQGTEVGVGEPQSLGFPTGDVGSEGPSQLSGPGAWHPRSPVLPLRFGSPRGVVVWCRDSESESCSDPDLPRTGFSVPFHR